MLIYLLRSAEKAAIANGRARTAKHEKHRRVAGKKKKKTPCSHCPATHGSHSAMQFLRKPVCGYMWIHILNRIRMGQAQRVAHNEITTIIIHSPPAFSVCPLLSGACQPDSDIDLDLKQQLRFQRQNHYEITNETTSAHCSVAMLKPPSDEAGPSP